MIEPHLDIDIDSTDSRIHQTVSRPLIERGGGSSEGVRGEEGVWRSQGDVELVYLKREDSFYDTIQHSSLARGAIRGFHRPEGHLQDLFGPTMEPDSPTTSRGASHQQQTDQQSSTSHDDGGMRMEVDDDSDGKRKESASASGSRSDTPHTPTNGQHLRLSPFQHYSQLTPQHVPIAPPHAALSSSPHSILSSPESPLSSLASINTLADAARAVIPPQKGPPPADLALKDLHPQNICLCQPQQRIPRPRNAFILYRQHHHAAVVAKYPGRPNPEISKIIGAMWKSSADDVKKLWQKHADEEKRQHLARYPQYRYQPRRNGKKHTASNSTAQAGEIANCSICGGKTGVLSTATSSPAGSTIASGTRGSRAESGFRKRALSPSVLSAITADHTGSAEALLQLGMPVVKTQESPNKRQKLDYTPSGSPRLATSATLEQYLRASRSPGPPASLFDHSSPSVVMGPPSDVMSYSRGASCAPSEICSSGLNVLQKIHALAGICRPISMSVPSTNTPRYPLITMESDDPGLVSDLTALLAKQLETEHSYQVGVISGADIDEPSFMSKDNHPNDMYMQVTLASGASSCPAEQEDRDFASYLHHISIWRAKAPEYRRALYIGDQGKLLLINRYMLSRTDCAASHLSSDGLSAKRHWQWCASVWRGCVGADMTIFITRGSGAETDGALEIRDEGKVPVVLVRLGEAGDEKIAEYVRRLSFEVQEVVRKVGLKSVRMAG